MPAKAFNPSSSGAPRCFRDGETNVTSISGKQEELANLLVQARRDVSQFSLPTDLAPDTALEAYAVNEIVAQRLGWEPLGWKIAGTTDAVRGKLQLDGPIYGRTFRRFACTSPARFTAAELLDPLIECEFFVTLARDLPPREKPWTFPETIAAIAEVHAGIEVAECRYPRKALPPLPAFSLMAAPRAATSLAIKSRTGATDSRPYRFGSKSTAHCAARALAPTSWAIRCGRCGGWLRSAGNGATDCAPERQSPPGL